MYLFTHLIRDTAVEVYKQLLSTRSLQYPINICSVSTTSLRMVHSIHIVGN